MSGNNHWAAFLSAILLIGFLEGCRLPTLPGFNQSGSQTDSIPTTGENLRYSKQWTLTGPPDVASVLSESTALQGQCEFSTGMLATLREADSGVLLPVMTLAPESSLAPDFAISASLYESLRRFIDLESAATSLNLFQSVLGSVEHACPENASRKVTKCTTKEWLDLVGLNQKSALYDWKRLERWFSSRPSVGFLIVPNASIYNGSAILHTRYSHHGRMLTNATDVDRLQAVKPLIGSLRLDWVPTNDLLNQKQFASGGYCQLDWSGQHGDVSLEQRQLVHNALLPEFITFMEKALQVLPMN